MVEQRFRSFRDRRLHFLVNCMVPFSTESVKAALKVAWERTSPFGSEEENYGLSFLTMLNALLSRFSLLDGYFVRGSGFVVEGFVNDLLAYVMSNLSDGTKLAGAGITSSLLVEDIMAAIRQEIARVHTTRLSSEEYGRIQTVQEMLTLSTIKPYLPHYVQSEFAKVDSVVDQAIQNRLGPGLTRNDLRNLAMALVQLEKSRGWDWVSPQQDVIKKYGRLILTVDGFFDASLDDLYAFPPFLVEGPNREYANVTTEMPFLWIKRREIEFINSVKQRHSNLTGDSLEKLLEQYLQTRQLVLDTVPPIGMLDVERHHPHHFAYARSSIRLSRNTREDMFALLQDPNQLEIEIDLVGNHAEGFSIIGEAKWVARYENAETAYYKGTADKEAEQGRLLALAGFFDRNPARKSELKIPPQNPVIPVFITNAVGPLFANHDGIVKASPLEVMEVEPFYRLLKDHLAGSR